MAKPAKRRSKKKFIGLLANHVDRRDDETLEVMAYSREDAWLQIIEKMNKSRFSLRFSLRSVLTATEARKNWA